MVAHIDGMPGRRDPGQAAVLMVAALAVTGALIVGLVQVVTVVVARQQAQSAADAAALAGVSGGPDIAAEIAARNHALLVSSQWEGDDLVVVVAVATMLVIEPAAKRFCAAWVLIPFAVTILLTI
mgnify:CR=1 FL=1